jgi:hypothetical protein
MRTGFKLVHADLAPFAGDKTLRFAVDTVHRLPEGTLPIVCRVGFHYCPVALDCLRYVRVYPGCHLLRVQALDDATVVTDNGLKYCASAIQVVEDVTERIGELLTGMLVLAARHEYCKAVHYTSGLQSTENGDLVITVARWADGACCKRWGQGKGPDGNDFMFLGADEKIHVWRDDQIVAVVDANDGRWPAYSAVMKRREPWDVQVS